MRRTGVHAVAFYISRRAALAARAVWPVATDISFSATCKTAPSICLRTRCARFSIDSQVCSLLEVPPDKLEFALTHRKVTAGGETYELQLNLGNAQDTRDALAKVWLAACYLLTSPLQCSWQMTYMHRAF